ncbi:hypothetical protein HXX76_004078 [Chlamydomonas incerta]|uniref:Protein kinase domain-containing protein n=1 Tax=Chlamydomonas incerta TaxID=51695 RepID=A0A835T6Y0_CHLIN|nr:hypothetical protein HXX76_004078 [Chlamydomonas incerta]|eukprot:KAG2439959.1 hypothetical protein HXX76_004078 [Chlamydomonas incerta]
MIQLGPGAVLQFRHLVVSWWSSRSELLLATPSFAPMAPSSAPSATGPPLLLFNNCALAVRSGLAPASTLAYFESLPRPPSLPGVQQVVTSVNQTGCLNATVYNATANTTTPRVPAPAAMELCRQVSQRGVLVDFGVEATMRPSTNSLNAPAPPANYVTHFINATYLMNQTAFVCKRLITNTTAADGNSSSGISNSTSGINTFLLSCVSGEARAAPQSEPPSPPAQLSPPPSPAAPAGLAAGLLQNTESGGGSGGGSSSNLGLIVGCVVGGVTALVLVAAVATALLVTRCRQRQHSRPNDYAAAADGKPSSASSDVGGACGLAAVCVVNADSSQPHLGGIGSASQCSGSGSSKAPISVTTLTPMGVGSATAAGAGSDSGGSFVPVPAASQWPSPLTKATLTSTADSASLEQHLSRHLQQQEALVTSATPYRENLNIRASVEMSSHPDSIPAQSQAQTSANTYLSTVNSNAFGDFCLRQAHAHASSHPAQLSPGQGSTAVTSGATAALAALAVRPTSCIGIVGQGAQQDSAGGGAGAVDSGSEGDSVVHLLPVVLGKGGFGRVVAGTYRGQPVAVKQLLDDAWWAAGPAGAGPAGGGVADAGQRDELVRAFVQEVQILGRCDHPNVARLHAVCLTPPHLSLVLERCETSLDKLIYGGAGNAAAGGRGSPGGNEDKSEPLGARGPPPLLPLSKVLHIAIQVAKGLEYLHPTIVHRDLKPANVLLNDADGPSPVAKLSDFGLSRMRNATQSTMQPQAGTAAYLAPECFSVEDSTSVGHRADIYSFGVLLWTMLSGKQPWADFSLVAIAFKVGLQQQRLPLEHLQAAGRCTPKLDKLIVQCWETDPLRRPAAGEVWKALMLCEQELRGAA